MLELLLHPKFIGVFSPTGEEHEAVNCCTVVLCVGESEEKLHHLLGRIVAEDHDKLPQRSAFPVEKHGPVEEQRKS